MTGSQTSTPGSRIVVGTEEADRVLAEVGHVDDGVVLVLPATAP
jgi:hypothetical protein